MITLARGSSSSSGGGSRSYSGGSRSRSYSGGSSSSRPRSSGGSTVIHNHIYAPRVYGGRSYGYRGGGWGYGYYGPHPYFDSWYGYPVYYGYPGHWSGWDWPVGLLVILAIVGLIALGVRWYAW